jgi:hypothetical protein
MLVSDMDNTMVGPFNHNIKTKNNNKQLENDVIDKSFLLGRVYFVTESHTCEWTLHGNISKCVPTTSHTTCQVNSMLPSLKDARISSPLQEKEEKKRKEFMWKWVVKTAEHEVIVWR